jgi:hypothetical protein
LIGVGYLGKKAFRHQWHDEDFYNRAVWVKRFAWWPKHCDLSGRRLWLKKVMMGVAVYTGPGDTVFEFRWHDAKEHVFWKLKNEPTR